MLIEKAIEANDVVTIKLVTQEEIVAKFVSQDTNTVTIQKPVLLNVSIDEKTGRPGIQMLPFFVLGANSDSKITLKHIHIITMLTAADEVKSGYIHNTSGIAVPRAGEKGLIV